MGPRAEAAHTRPNASSTQPRRFSGSGRLIRYRSMRSPSGHASRFSPSSGASSSKEGVFAAAIERGAERIRRQRGAAAPGDVAGAVAILVEHYEELGDAVLRLLAEEGGSAPLHAIVERAREQHAEWCERVFAPALAPLHGVARKRRLAQLMAVCDVYVWKILRRDRRLSRAQASRAILELLEPLME